MVAVFDPQVYGEPVFWQLLIVPEVYGEEPLAAGDTNVDAGLASGTGTAYDATASTTSDTNVDAGLAAGTGAAFGPAASITVNAGVAVGTGAAYDADGAVPVEAAAGLASGTGSAFGPSASVAPTAGNAAGNGVVLSSYIYYPYARITIGGVEYTNQVLFSTARFTAMANGQAGDCYIRLRDPDRTISFPTGEAILLTIEGAPAWRGYLSQYQRVFIAPALNVDDFGETRFFDIIGAEINVLFSKRIVFSQSDPEVVEGKLYPPFQADRPVVLDLVADYLDLSSDVIDTTTFVENVGDITEDQEGRAWSAGDTWGQAMQSIASLPAAVYYLRATMIGADLVYTDVDTPDAPYAMSDVPTGDQVGYREMEVLLDGTALVNDQLAWGIGYGSDVPVFVRDEDAASQAEHGLWQAGKVVYGVNRQSTINRIAESIVDGSPQSKRGHKGDAEAVTLVTYTPGFLVGQKVDFTSEVFGYQDVIPIRKMEVTFEAPDNPKFALTLSHVIDIPFGFQDPWLWSLQFPPFSLLPFPPFPPLPGPDQCTDVVCGITDDFERTEASEFGTATCGLTWATISTAGTVVISVDGDAGVIDIQNAGPGARNASLRLGGSGSSPYQVDFDEDAVRSLRFQIPDFDATASFNLRWAPCNTPGAIPGPNLVISDAGSSHISFTSLPGTAIPNAFWDAASTYTWTVLRIGTDTRTSITDGVNTYSVDSSTDPTVAQCALSLILDSASSPQSVRILDIAIPELTRCTLSRFDNFARSEAVDWGTASSGIAWSLTTSSNADVSVGSSVGRIALNSSAGSAQAVNEATVGPGEWWMNPSYDMIVPFQTDNVANTGLLRFLFFNDAFTTFRGVDLDVSDDVVGVFNETGNDDQPFSDWTDDEPMMLRFQVESGVAIRARVWRSSDPEPSTWNSEKADTDSAMVPNFRVEADDAGDATDSVVAYRYIDFDFGGKPCYPGSISFNCAYPAYLDTFQRIVPSGLGTASSGLVWDQIDSSAFIDVSVAGGEGLFEATIPGVENGVEIETWQVVDGIGPWTREFIMIAKVTIDPTAIPTGGTNRLATILFQISNDVVQSAFIDWTYAWSGSGSLGPYIGLNSTGVSDETPYTPPGAGTYFLKWHYSDGVISEGKVWRDDEFEPDYMVSIVPGSVPDPVNFSLDSIYNAQPNWGTDFTHTVAIEYISFCALTELSSSPISPSFNQLGYGCEIPTRMGSSLYRVSAAMVPGTSRVLINGIRQRRGGLLDYVEDAPNGEIVFTGPEFPGEDDVVEVCYYTAGPIGAGGS